MTRGYRVWSSEYGTEADARLVEAWDAEEAAEAWAEKFSRLGEAQILGGKTITVHTRDVSTGYVQTWVVSGELRLEYYARDVAG